MANSYQKQPRIAMAIMRNLSITQDNFRSALESKDSQIKQTEWDTYFNWDADAAKRFQNSKIASLKDSLQKGNEK